MDDKDTKKLSKLRTPREIFNLLEENVAVVLDASAVKVFTLDESETKLVLRRNIDLNPNQKEEPVNPLNTSIWVQDPLIVHLMDVQKAVLTREINDNIAVALTEKRKTFLNAVREKMSALGAEICVPGFFKDKLVVIFMFDKKMSKHQYSQVEIEALGALARQSARVIDSFNGIKREVELFVSSIRKINDELEAKDVYTRGHSHRVAQFSAIMGRKLADEVSKIPFGEVCLYYAAELHDVGKTNLPVSIIQKQDRLDDKEWEKMKTHPFESSKIIKPLEKWFGRVVIEAVLYHHENFDGTGYPYGKKGEETNILARIIRVADTFDAMITDRPYRKALSHHECITELKRIRGIKLDAKVVDAFLEAYKEGLFKEVFYSQLESGA
ncbi:MAG: HD domain-containing protein [Candidatus Omnitrophica bacterium]|nr:HD domain-containing protein [Candidatus Omnitrophota bacterium]